jgi:hypothetical protein
MVATVGLGSASPLAIGFLIRGRLVSKPSGTIWNHLAVLSDSVSMKTASACDDTLGFHEGKNNQASEL